MAGYFVERSQGAGSTNFVQIGATSSTNYEDTDLVPNTNYNYRVRATDSFGRPGTVLKCGTGFYGTFDQPTRGSIDLHADAAVQRQFGSNLTWSVDGVVGGSASSGTITGTGLYSPPGSAGTHSVTVTNSDLSESASATVYVTG